MAAMRMLKRENAGVGQPAVFSVLDGQQRLTTLFLLHWYLAVADDCLRVFAGSLSRRVESRVLLYKTRPDCQ